MGNDWEKLAGEKGRRVPSGRLSRALKLGKMGAKVAATTLKSKAESLVSSRVKGEEVRHFYGAKSDAVLLATYGFQFPPGGNPYSSIVLELAVFNVSKKTMANSYVDDLRRLSMIVDDRQRSSMVVENLRHRRSSTIINDCR